MPYFAARTQRRRQPYLKDVVHHLFTTDGIQSKLPAIRSETQWGLVQKVQETNALFLLYYGPITIVPVPKRFFRDDAQMEEWRRLVESAIAPKKILTPGLLGRWF